MQKSEYQSMSCIPLNSTEDNNIVTAKAATDPENV